MNTIYNDLYLMPVVLNLFDGYTNTTLDAGLSDEMKAMGVTNFINVRTNVLETLKAFNAKLLK